MALNRVVNLAGTPEVNESFKASEAITPGHLCEPGQPTATQVRKHATAAGNALPCFALERDELGRSMDIPYAINDQVKLGIWKKGERVNALIGIGQNLTGKEFLESAGDGTLRALVTDAATDDTQRTSVIARSDESTGGAVAAVTRHRVVIV